MPSFKGKLIGAGIGVFLGGPVGALVGAMIGYYFHDVQQEEVTPRYTQRIYQQPAYAEFIFTANLVALLTAVAKADGQVDREEVAVIRRFFQNNLGYRGEELELIKNLIKQALRTDLDLVQVCGQFYSISNHQTRLLLLKLLYMVAYADKVIKDSEQALIDKIAALIRISAAEHMSIKAEFTGNEDRYYQILGVRPGASPDEIKQAYRSLVKKNHPDKVAHLGEEYTKIANERLSQINEAYDHLSRKLGL
jgi:DnaJ like chaperone protein